MLGLGVEEFAIKSRDKRQVGLSEVKHLTAVTKKNVFDILILVFTLVNCPLEEEDNV